MDPVKKLHWEHLSELEDKLAQPEPDNAPGTALSSILRIVRLPAGHTSSDPAGPSSSQDWAGLIERVRAAASHAREVETQAQEQELRVQELLERVRKDIIAAGERVRAAEARTSNMQIQAEARIKAAEERAETAEERARFAEEWLSRLHETITSEFAAVPDGKLSA